MRLKQLLGILLLAVVSVTMAAAAVSHMTGVNVATQGDATTITIQASGAFTHTEYRPSDNLLLVDLAGVSTGAMEGKTQALKTPAVASYRVLGFKGTGGTDVARVEFTLAPSAGVHINQTAKGLMVTLTVPGSTPAEVPAAVTAPEPSAAATETHASAKSASRPVVIQNVAVARSKSGVNVEILGSGAMTPKAMKLSGPDRVVIDVANAVPLHKRDISVNSADVKSIRVARFQVDPPVTRVVVDLASAKDFEIVPSGRKLTVKLRPAEAAAAPATTPAPASVEPAKTETATATPAPAPSEPAATPTQQSADAKPFVMVQPNYEPKADKPVETAKAEDMKPASRSESAIAKFGAPKEEVPLMKPSQPSAALMPSKEIGAAMQQQATMTSAPQGTSVKPKFTGEPISVNLKDVDLKDFFRLIHQISGLNIVLDPNVRGTLTLVLDNVPWDQALDIVLKNNGLATERDGNVLRIATLETMRKEADAQRAQLEARALADPKITVTRVLSYAHSKDVVPVIKKFLSQRGEIISDDRINALIIQDIPSVFPEVDRLLVQLDRKTPEVEIEARVIAATRNFARDIGVQLGFGTGNNVFAVGGASSVGTSPLQTPGITSAQYLRTGNSIPLFSNLGVIQPTSGISFINANSHYRLDAILTMAESRGLLKILSRPRVVTQNNITAIVRQGVKVPIVTLAQLGGPPTTTYIDAFLRLTVTPQITAENTIFLALDVENTTPDFGHEVQGNPTLITQQAITNVLVTDGGTVMIGGVIQTQNNVTVDQVPLLGSIPGLGNLFKHRTVTTSTQELIFFITPKIIQT